MNPLLRGLAALALLGLFSVPAMAEPATSPGDDATWELHLADLERDLLRAHARVTAAHDAYRNWRQKKHPRGAKKGELLAEIDAAEIELADLQANRIEDLEKARRAGVLPGVLRRFETPPAATDR